QKMRTPRLLNLPPTPLQTRYLLWQIPAQNGTVLFPSGIGTPQEFYCDGSILRLPRPGFAIGNGNPNNFILHENLRPAKIVAAGRFTLGALATRTVTLPSNVPSTVFVGGQFSPNGQDVLLPMVVENGFLGQEDVLEYCCQFRFLTGNQIQFRE